MPEPPDAENYRRYLERRARRKAIAGVWVAPGRPIGEPELGTDGFRERFAGKRGGSKR